MPDAPNWDDFSALAKVQGIFPVIIDTAVKNAPMPDRERLASFKRTAFSAAMNNEKLLSAQDEVIRWFDEAGISSVILKGTSASVYYPQPETRPLGDIDILVSPEDVQKAAEIIENNGYQKTEIEHGFHIGYRKNKIVLELHYAPTDVPNSKGGMAANAIMDGYLTNTQTKQILGHEFPALSEQNQALCLLMHMERHLLTGGIGLRQLCDWAAFISKTNDAVFENEILPLLSACGMAKFARISMKTCAMYLGIPLNHPELYRDISDEICERFMESIFASGNLGKAAEGNMQSFFIDREATGGETKGKLATLIGKVSAYTRSRYPVTEKHPILLPFFMAYLPLRYKIRSFRGLRPKNKVSEILSNAKENDLLFRELQLYEVKQTKK